MPILASFRVGMSSVSWINNLRFLSHCTFSINHERVCWAKKPSTYNNVSFYIPIRLSLVGAIKSTRKRPTDASPPRNKSHDNCLEIQTLKFTKLQTIVLRDAEFSFLSNANWKSLHNLIELWKRRKVWQHNVSGAHVKNLFFPLWGDLFQWKIHLFQSVDFEASCWYCERFNKRIFSVTFHIKMKAFKQENK